MRADRDLALSKDVYALAKYGDTIVYYMHGAGLSATIRIPEGNTKLTAIS